MNPIQNKIAEAIKEEIRQANFFLEGRELSTVLGVLTSLTYKYADIYEEEYQNTTHCRICNQRLVKGINCPEHRIMNIPFNKTQFEKTAGAVELRADLKHGGGIA